MVGEHLQSNSLLGIGFQELLIAHHTVYAQATERGEHLGKEGLFVVVIVCVCVCVCVCVYMCACK